MYNKIFTKILDSSIWLESTTTRLVWLTFLAAMDEDGFVQFASVANLAHRARVPLDEAHAAVECLLGPDPDSSDPDNEGRRIEKVPGGWMILNSAKYRELVTRAVSKEQTRARVARFREKKKCNVTCNARVTQSEGEAEAQEEAIPPQAEAVVNGKKLSTLDRIVLMNSTRAATPENKVTLPPKPSAVAARNAKRLPTAEQSIRISQMFHRRLTTPWQRNEIAAYKELGIIEEDDLTAVEQYYSANWPPKTGVNILRHDILTFLNNFHGEVGRARNSNPKSINTTAAPVRAYMAPSSI
jgi:hypothetical protein